MTALDGAAFVQPPFGVQVGFMSGLWSAVVPKVHANSIRHDASVKRAVLCGFNAKKAGLIVFGCPLNVLNICRGRNIAQIGPSIIRWVAVNMVNVILRPLAGHVQKRNAVRPIFLAINADPVVSARVDAPKHPGLAGPAGFLFQAREDAGLGIVMKQFAHALRGKIGNSHEAVLSLIGQRPVSVSSTCGLRYFSVGG